MSESYFIYVMKVLHFIKLPKHEDPDNLEQKPYVSRRNPAWSFLVDKQLHENPKSNPDLIKTKSLFNFLCYLQSIDQNITSPYDMNIKEIIK